MASDLVTAQAEPCERTEVTHRSGFCVGGISVQVAGVRSDDVALVTALEPFRDDLPFSDINLQVEWVKQLVPRQRPGLFDSGTTWRLYEEGSDFGFDFSAPLFGDAPYKRLIVDCQFRRGAIQLSVDSLSAASSPVSPLDYPLDELLIMHRLTQEKAIELHGCGIVRANGIGDLFVGHSGAGKSTTTRLWTSLENVEVLSDDRIIVRRDEVRSVANVCYGNTAAVEEAGILRLRDRSTSPTGHSAQDDKKSRMRMYGTPWHGEAMYASPNSAPLARIFVLEHGHGNVLTPLSPSQAVAELFARSFVPFHRHEYVDSALQFLQEVVDAVPVYRYSFEPGPRAVDTILNLRD